MLGRTQSIHQSIRIPVFTMERFRRQTVWGAVAAVALLAAALSSRSEVGVQRASNAVSALDSSPGDSGRAAPFDAQAATRQLAEAVHGLAQDRDRLATRLAAVEHDIDDVTGSISRQIEAAKAADVQALVPWPGAQQPVPMIAASIAAMVAPSPATLAMTASPSEEAVDTAAAAPRQPAYGADIGGATSIKTLQSRWVLLNAAHPQLFVGLHPSVTLRENPRTNRTELRLLIGPLPNAEKAAQLCAELAAFRLACEPTMFGNRLALQ